jgi:hypothetical protein
MAAVAKLVLQHVRLGVQHERPSGIGSFKALLFRALKLAIPQDIRAGQIHSAVTSNRLAPGTSNTNTSHADP